MSTSSIPPQENFLLPRLLLFRCRRVTAHVTSPFTAMDAGCIRCRKRHLRWCFFISIRRPEALSPQQTISTLPPGFKGTTFTSEILLSPDGHFLYAANRLHDTIAIFSLSSDGRLHYLGEVSTMGDYPRHIQLDPSGSFMYACNQRSDSIASFRVDRKTGLLTFTGRYTSVGSPACTLFLA